MDRLQVNLLSRFYRNLRSFNSIRLDGSFDGSQETDVHFTRVVGRLAHSISYDDDTDTQSGIHLDVDARNALYGELTDVELGRMLSEEPEHCDAGEIALALVDLDGLHVITANK